MSALFNGLTRHCQELRKQFLPKAFDPIGRYPDQARVHALARGYVVLGHAEVEHFIEEWARALVRGAERVWTRDTRVTPPLAFLVAAVGQTMPRVEALPDLKSGDSHERMNALVQKAIADFRKTVAGNHGIKQKNVLSLFDPLGVPESAYPTTLLQDLDAYGSLRGKHAHGSAAAMAVSSVLDPETEFKRLSSLVTDLGILDAWLVTYRRRVR